jgi:AraC-like DNA-binding protein
MSRFHFARRFKHYVGVSPHHYFTGCRLNRARELVQTTDRPVAAIARELGFADYAYFCRVFRRVVGTSPGSLDRYAPARRARSTAR